MTIETITISDIKPYEKNAKSHPKKQVDLLAENIKRFGFTTPCLVDKDNNLIAGHGRLEAVKTLSWTDVPCVRMENLTEDEVKALRFADNKLAEMSEWDMGLVEEELFDLSDELKELSGFADIEPEVLDGFSLPDGDKPEYQQITFTLHNTQAELVKESLKAVQQMGVEPDSDNENSNGNAIYTICKTWFQQKI